MTKNLLNKDLQNLKSTISSNLPIAKLIVENYISNDTNNIGIIIYTIFVIAVKLLIWIYTFYTIWKCLKLKDDKGNYVNTICEFVIAGCCLPCYLIWRTFISPCKLAPNVSNPVTTNPVTTNSSSN